MSDLTIDQLLKAKEILDSAKPEDAKDVLDNSMVPLGVYLKVVLKYEKAIDVLKYYANNPYQKFEEAENVLKELGEMNV